MTEIRALVTGASRGIGRAIALRLAREGAKVALAARSSDQLDAVAAEVEAAGGQALAVQMNVVDHGSVEAAVWRALQFTGEALDLLVNCAGTFDVKPMRDTDEALLRRLLDVNLVGPFHVTRECLDALEEGERPIVVNISSEAGRKGFAGSTAYCATKYGLRGFSDALREELVDQGIRVSTIYPGATDTTIFDKVPGEWDRSKMNQPEDVAEVVWETWKAGPDEDVADVVVPPREAGVSRPTQQH